ncbi:hypothetical protein BT96DRAFT_928066, partial [Gymnopus androsaceus JB14]
VTVDSPSKALIIATHLDETPKKFRLESERGFQTITGRYKDPDEDQEKDTSKPVQDNAELHQLRTTSASKSRSSNLYHNINLVEELLEQVDSLGTLEMETHHLYHLAKCWNRRPKKSSSVADASHTAPSLTTGPVQPVTLGSGASSGLAAVAITDSKLHVSAAQMVFAARTSANRDFITPERVKAIEEWGGRGVLEALIAYDIPAERMLLSMSSASESLTVVWYLRGFGPRSIDFHFSKSEGFQENVDVT